MAVQRSKESYSHSLLTREWLDSGGCFTIGKYKGELAYDIALTDSSYIRWIIESVENIDDQDRELLSSLLKTCGRGK